MPGATWQLMVIFVTPDIFFVDIIMPKICIPAIKVISLFEIVYLVKTIHFRVEYMLAIYGFQMPIKWLVHLLY